eukprot:scaffold9517_cov117-Isochrysis_galbana.AAC.1
MGGGSGRGTPPSARLHGSTPEPPGPKPALHSRRERRLVGAAEGPLPRLDSTPEPPGPSEARAPLSTFDMREGWRAQPRDPSLGATRRRSRRDRGPRSTLDMREAEGSLPRRDPSATRRRGAANEAARPGCRDSDDSGRRRRRPDQSNEPGRRLSDRMAMPVLHGQAHVRHGDSRQRTALNGRRPETITV